jgi:NADPH:quinone reductase-like Zn-dependent oxidoreductase
VLLGARVVAVTRGADKAAYLLRLGAAEVVDMGEGDPALPLHKRLRAVAPKGGWRLPAAVMMGVVGGGASH